MPIIKYLGHRIRITQLQGQLGTGYHVHHLKDEMALLTEFGAHYEVGHPDMVICELDLLWSEFKNYTDLVNFIRDSNPTLPILLLDNTRSGEVLGSFGDNVWFLVSDDINVLVKHINETFHAKH